MKNILVLGGTRFFGRNLVEKLIDDGHNVTILTRGHSGNPFGKQVKQLVADRMSKKSLAAALQGLTFDVVYDNICFSPTDAQNLCDVLNGHIGKLVFTSTMATYELDGAVKQEDDFNPYTYPIQYGVATDFSYGEGKRLAEAVFFKEAKFPVVAVRFPIVLGEDDYTERLHFYVRKVLQEKPFTMQNLQAKMGFILAEEAALFLAWAGEVDVEGPFNAVATGEVKLEDLMGYIEGITGKKAKITIGTASEPTPYDVPDSWYMTNEKATLAGFEFTNLQDWLPILIEAIVQQEQTK